MVAVAIATAASAFLVSFPSPHSWVKTSHKLGNEHQSVDTRGIKRNSVNSNGIQVKANLTEINGIRKHDIDNATSHAQQTFINQFPWRNVEDGFVFSQNFPIRSYEIRADQTASIETIMNHLQRGHNLKLVSIKNKYVSFLALGITVDRFSGFGDMAPKSAISETALNHAKAIRVFGDGFGSTPEMCKRNLIWVVTKMRVIVDRYPTWGDVVQVSTWMAHNGKNSNRRDWVVRDSKTSQILARASSSWSMINKETRRLSKFPDEVRGEIGPYFVDAPPVVDDDYIKLPKLDETTADYVLSGLTPRWSDLDVNQHVNNVKYIGWILESIPQVVEKYELASITLEYRRECRKDSVLKSLTTRLDGCDDGDNGGIADFNHVLLFEGGSDGARGGEIVRGRTEWRPKCENRIRNINSFTT
ncbi:hypothetical protein QVD17_23021 [Tagetes erecta]|uniref:Acyl-[acyl-carrier-protein] hydrolase n=1 Tax=Tagetes erecta TaxID=13708 RepID=A0AAD8KG53_TARER|nr:hypothetical protein QVD17_23021 [Tagetes erecta]